MSDADKYSREFQVDASLEEALERFGQLTREELLRAAEDGDGGALIVEGTTEAVAFRGAPIRKTFHEGEWWFSIIDVVEALTGSSNPRRYWSDLKSKLLKDEGYSELYDDIVQLKLTAADGKHGDTDAVNPETLFRIVQSIPSPRAEPFKKWLARVAYERIQEIQNPEIAIKRAIMEYQLQGRSMDWIEHRIRSIMVRKELTSEWQKRGVHSSNDFAILIGILSTRTFGIRIGDHKVIKNLRRRHNLRDHMTDLELILTMLAEKSTKEIAQIRDAQGFVENKGAARSGGDIAGNARRSLEAETGKSVVSSSNFLPKRKKQLTN